MTFEGKTYDDSKIPVVAQINLHKLRVIGAAINDQSVILSKAQIQLESLAALDAQCKNVVRRELELIEETTPPMEIPPLNQGQIELGKHFFKEFEECLTKS